MGAQTVDRPIERSFRTLTSDNRRWERFVFRPGDICVCTPPKCGTTWMQTIVNTLIFPSGQTPGPVTRVHPWLDARFDPIGEVIARLEAQTHRRSIKTHTPADGIPWHPEASYVVVGRDGRDAFMSFVNHMRNMRPDVLSRLAASAPADGIALGEPPPLDDLHAFFAFWLRGATWFEHVASFWPHRNEENVLFVHFNNLKADLDAEMRRVGAFLSVEVDAQVWPELVERCTFASMKTRASEIGDFDAKFVGGAASFLYKGTNDRWRDLLTDEELAAFDRRSEELLTSEAIAWTTTGILS